jgi:hypothetical protein
MKHFVRHDSAWSRAGFFRRESSQKSLISGWKPACE